jgi:transcription elongation factor Elf1
MTNSKCYRCPYCGHLLARSHKWNGVQILKTCKLCGRFVQYAIESTTSFFGIKELFLDLLQRKGLWTHPIVRRIRK